MKMGNVVPRTGLESTSLAFRASVLPLHHGCFPGVTTISTASCLCSSLPQRSVQTTTLIPLELYVFQCLQLHTQRQWPYICIDSIGSTTIQHIALLDAGQGTSVMGVMKMRNIVPRSELEPTSLAFQASVLPYVSTISTATGLCKSLPQRSVQYYLASSKGAPTANIMCIRRQ